uniref:Cilia and flagella associated protein 210 n=1 Tax=Rattus norvegicus TaxID=10116 RepID=F1MAP6_RAT|eukprot:XP_017447179.1 PREDICTED: coiled-coil domain-containing protein 173 isoform X2 [Rattus norvegicus]
MQVRYGRRSGKAKERAGMESYEKEEIPYPPLLPSTVDLQQVTIIPHAEWERIRDSLNKLTREAAVLRAERTAKKNMHMKSQELVKHWTNTYAGMKEQKLRAKQKRDEELEAERQILDLEEEIYKQGERKKAIENAKQYQFYQTERVKRFHSGLLLSRVMKERDVQIQYKKNAVKSDEKWEEQVKLNDAKALKEDQEKLEKQRRERVALAKDHLKQIKEHEEEEETRKKSEEKDAEEIKRQNLLYEIEMKKKLSRKQEEIDASRKRFFDNMRDKNIIRAVEQQQQEEEEEKTRKFIKAKKRLIQMRKDKEAETHSMSWRVSSLLLSLWSSICLLLGYLLLSMKNKEEEEKQRKIESKEELQAVLKADKMFQELEKEKKLKANKEKLEVQDAHIHQIALNKFNSKQLKEEDLNYWRLTEALAVEKEKEFEKYAREVINFESESTKKYTYPMVKAVQEGVGGGRGPPFVGRGGIRPSYQANDVTGVQLPFYNSQGSKYDFQKSKRRLGFTW